MAQQSSSKSTIASYLFSASTFANAEEVIAEFKSPHFKKLDECAQYNKVNHALLDFIQKEAEPCFLLPAVIHFIHEINQNKCLESYTINSFEFWLNQFSGFSEEENYRVRAKIAGRHIPRDDYQVFFPIGMGKRYGGSHYVTGHGSPDLDTTVASFWGWLDAFSARVSEGQHIWNLPPGGILSTKDAGALTDILGKEIFSTLSQNRSSLALSGLDFTCQTNLIKKTLKDSILDSDHVRHKNALMIVDELGYFLGDLRTADYEGIRQIQAIMTHCIIWFENSFHTKFIALFTQETIEHKDITHCAEELFNLQIKRSLDTRTLSPAFFSHFNNYLSKILDLPQGSNATFREFAEALKKLSHLKLLQFKVGIRETFKKKSLFDKLGSLIESRPQIFKLFNEIIHDFDQAVTELQYFTETIDIALKIKEKVFGFPPRYVTPLSTLDELVGKMSVFHHLTVVFPNKSGKLWPLGIIRAQDINKPILGTVSLRDFCNREEVKIASYFEIISVVDHHKVELKTKSTPVILTGDVQSSNVLLAEKSFEINDRYTLSEWSTEHLSSQLEKLAKKSMDPSELRVQKRLLTHKLASFQSGAYFVHSERVFLEYLTYLHAIIDDTDLLSKVTPRDLYCIAELLNRMKSILLKEEVEIIHLNSIQQDVDFVKKAVRLIVENADMYSIYSKIFEEKELHINKSIGLAALGKASDIFSDCKEQNGCCRISQTKIFSTNAVELKKNYEKLLNSWVEKAQEVYQNNNEIDLHIHMMSTIPNAEEVHKGLPKQYLHRDYLWIWIPDSKQALDHLASFLNAFKGSETVRNINMHYQVLGAEKQTSYSGIFKHHFLNIPKEAEIKVQKKVPLAVLSFDAGTLNSRKAHITPYLPLLVK